MTRCIVAPLDLGEVSHFAYSSVSGSQYFSWQCPHGFKGFSGGSSTIGPFLEQSTVVALSRTLDPQQQASATTATIQALYRVLRHMVRPPLFAYSLKKPTAGRSIMRRAVDELSRSCSR